MIKILFVCHGNICRSPMAEFVMKDLAEKNNCEDKFFIASAATTNDDIGSDMYPNAKAELKKHGISFTPRKARRITRKEYSDWDYIVAMDHENISDLHYIMEGDPENKIKLLLSFSGVNREVSDPWYTRDFATAFNDIKIGCEGLFKGAAKWKNV